MQYDNSQLQFSIAERMVATGGRSTGFDYLRIILAMGVIIWHAFPLSYGAGSELALAKTPIGPVVDSIVPMFFALSGFLVAGSLERNSSLITFASLRVIRILPALAMEVLLSALILGPLLATVPLADYLTDIRFYSYFLNIFGDIHYALPGMFLANPFPNVVNGQLWTVPWELRCYLVLIGAAVIGVARKRALFLALTLASSLLLWGTNVYGGVHYNGAAMLIGFLGGVVIHQYRDIVSWSHRCGMLAAILMLGLLWIPTGRFFAGLPAAYFTVYLGLKNPRKISLLRGADYSYGLYLYGFVIQQAVADIFPWSHHWYSNLAITMPVASLFAAFSWTFVEKPALRIRIWLPHIESWAARVGRRSASPGMAPSEVE